MNQPETITVTLTRDEAEELCTSAGRSLNDPEYVALPDTDVAAIRSGIRKLDAAPINRRASLSKARAA